MAASHAPPLRPAARRAQLLALFALPLAPALLCACRVGDGATRRALALCAAASAAAFGLAARGVPVASEYMARKGNVGKDINKVRTLARTHARTSRECLPVQCPRGTRARRQNRTRAPQCRRGRARRGDACHLPPAPRCRRGARWQSCARAACSQQLRPSRPVASGRQALCSAAD